MVLVPGPHVLNGTIDFARGRLALGICRLPYAGLAFASVVSLIPGVFLFRMADGLVELVASGGHVSSNLLQATLADGVNAFLITLAITLGLILPKMLIGCRFNERFTGNDGRA
jgi:uncharacterized membrane protein YjjB (DUF3815 family)